MNGKIISKLRERAAKEYPYFDKDIAELDKDIKEQFVGEQADRRDGYVKGCIDVLSPEMLWQIYQAGKEVEDKFAGMEITTEFFGMKILENMNFDAWK